LFRKRERSRFQAGLVYDIITAQAKRKSKISEP
jgi:hypothetical protein